MGARLSTVLSVLRGRFARRKQRDRQSGVALLMTITTLTLMITLVANFTYDTTIQMAQTANARDELRAHYMARSAVNLSRLLIKIQSRFVEPVMAQAKSFLSGSLGTGMGISLRVTDYAGPIMSFFGGSKESSAMFGSLLGIDTSEAKGLGVANGSMDAEITAEDGKIDINCGSGVSVPGNIGHRTLFREITSLLYSPRYNTLFEQQNSSGQFVDRSEIGKAIIDWADDDEQKFDPMGSGSGSEDYRYDARKDRYYAHNGSYDTVEEIAMVYGVSTDVLEAFLPYLTVYANTDSKKQCRVNLQMIKGPCTPLLVGLIRAAAMPDPLQPPKDPRVLDDRVIYPLASILCERGSVTGFDDINTIVAVLNNPAQAISREDPRYEMMQSLQGINLTRQDLEQVAYVGAPRVYRIEATGEAGKVKKKITAILDTKRPLFNPLSQNVASEQAAGVFQYWREE